MSREPSLRVRTPAESSATEPGEISVLVIDQQEPERDVCAQVVRSLGYHPLAASSPEEALAIMEQHKVDIVLAEIGSGAGSGEALHHFKDKNPRLEIAIMTSGAAMPKAVQALKLGASEYVVKPFTTEELRVLIKRMAEAVSLKDENRQRLGRIESRDHFGRIVGESEKMKPVFRFIRKVAQARAPVLLLGESGTGKELVARAIHAQGPAKDRPFVVLDCGVLAPTLIESELFGHVRGAFTGANANKAGLIESAKDGTLFLDEVGELPIELQSRLLRAIQEKEFRPVGGTQHFRFESRIIAATNRELLAAVAEGTFRKDLYYRLNVASITLPPLRERRIDIPLIADRILKRFSISETAHRAKAPWMLSSEALDRLLNYDWPGNVRELENCLERAVMFASGPLIQLKDLPSSLQAPARAAAHAAPDAVIPLDDMERQAIERALTMTGGDKVRAARMLGIGRTTLYRKLSKYQLGDEETQKKK